MGMANKPPASHYKRTYHVVTHASDGRYRDRFRGTEIGHLSEEHLANYIDQKTHEAAKGGLGVKIIDNKDGLPAEVFPLGEENKLWSFVRPNKVERLSGRYPLAVVTVLTDVQVRKSLQSGKWKRVEKPRSTTRFTLPPEALDKLKGFKAGPGSMPIKLEFVDKTSGESVYLRRENVVSAEELINNPPHEDLLFVDAWLLLRTEQTTKLLMKDK